MITTQLDLEAFRKALDPEALVQDVLDATGAKAVAHERSHPHPGGWKDDTGELHRSYYYRIQGTTLEVGNTAGHASHLHQVKGYSVLTTFDSGKVVDMLKEAFEERR